GRLERVTWVVHPHIDAGHEVLRKAHLVILDERNASTEPRIPRLKVDLLDELLAALIGRVGLAGEDELDRALRVGQDPGQPIDLAEEQRRAPVRRETPGETEREDVRVLERSGRQHLPRVELTLGIACSGSLVHLRQELLLRLLMRRPEFIVRDVLDRIPDELLLLLLAPVPRHVLLVDLA